MTQKVASPSKCFAPATKLSSRILATSDLPNDFMIPSWHPLYTTSMTDEANQPTAVQRVIHHDCRTDNINAVYNNGVYDGTPDGNINYSLR